MTQGIGTYFIDREQLPLSPEEAEVVRQFHHLYYRHWLERGADTLQLSWFGHELVKCPLDLWVYQELIVRTRPDFIVETGTWCGGGEVSFAPALFLPSPWWVTPRRTNSTPHRPEHPRLRNILS